MRLCRCEGVGVWVGEGVWVRGCECGVCGLEGVSVWVGEDVWM